MPISEAETAPLLDVSGLSGGYGKVAVLRDVSLRIHPGEVVSLLGPNGAGKTTLLRVISGLLPRNGGSIEFDGAELGGADPRRAVNRGLVHVIEGHRVFTELSVMDNLLIAAFDVPKSERMSRVEEALEIFPEIAAKRKDKGGALSGGQQQMLAVAQGMVKRPKLLMLDEPSAGLSPVLVDRVLAVAAQLRENGGSVLLVEQLVEKALAVSDRVYALAQGQIVLTASASERGLSQRLEQSYFGVAH